MPSVSKKQKGFMAGCKHNPEKMRGKCPPKSVSAEFVAADTGRPTPPALPKKKR